MCEEQLYEMFNINELYNYANDINADFGNMNDSEKMSFILANPDLYRKSAKSCYEILCHSRILL